jgi:hypothetical protein
MKIPAGLGGDFLFATQIWMSVVFLSRETKTAQVFKNKSE